MQNYSDDSFKEFRQASIIIGIIDFLISFVRGLEPFQTIKSASKNYLEFRFWCDFFSVITLEAFWIGFAFIKLSRMYQVYRGAHTLILIIKYVSPFSF